MALNARRNRQGADAGSDPLNARRRFFIGAFGAHAVEHHGVAFQSESMVFGNFVLTTFDFLVAEFDHLIAVRADEVVVMIAVIQLKDGLAAVELAAHQDASLFELCEHAVNGGQTDVDIFGNQRPIHVFSALVTFVSASENVENLEARKSRLQAGTLEVNGIGHT